MEDDVGRRYLNNMPQISMNLTDISVSSYLSILKYPKRLHMINQENDLVAVLGDIEYDRLGEI